MNIPLAQLRAIYDKWWIKVQPRLERRSYKPSAVPPLPNVRSVSELKWQELEEVNVDEVVESIMLHWRKSVCKRLSIIRR